MGGWSVTLVGPSARCQQRQNLALPNARRGTLHPSREKERNIFSLNPSPRGLNLAHTLGGQNPPRLLVDRTQRVV